MAQHAEDAIKLLGNNQEDRNGEAKSDFETPDDEPVCHRCTVNIEDGILHLENGDSANLLNIVEACMTAYCETGSYKYMESADEVGKIAGLMKGPHGQWITAR